MPPVMPKNSKPPAARAPAPQQVAEQPATEATVETAAIESKGEVAVIPPGKSVLRDMADRYGMEPLNFQQVVMATCFVTKAGERQVSAAEFAAFLLVAKQYQLNPVTREIFGFRGQSGAIVPIVSVDGWLTIINNHPSLNGFEFDDHHDDAGKMWAITCRIFRKDREHPIVLTEYMEECQRPTEPWKKWPRRMLRHKTLIQTARYAFGFAGIFDPDEAERMGVDTSPMHEVNTQNGNRPALAQQTGADRDVGPPSAKKSVQQEAAKATTEAAGEGEAQVPIDGEVLEPIADEAAGGQDEAKKSTTIEHSEPETAKDDGPPTTGKATGPAIARAQEAAQRKATPNPITEPERFREFMVEKFSEGQSIDDINEAWERYVEPYTTKMMPSDRTELSEKYGAAQRRIEGEDD